MKERNIIVPLFLVWMSAVTAPAQMPDLQQLKTKLPQPEQMMQDLLKQMATVEANEDARQPPSSAKAAPPATVPPPALPTTYIAGLIRTREVANQDPEGAACLDAEYVDPSSPGSFRLPRTGTLIKSGGFVKTNLFVDANQAGTYCGRFVPSWCVSSFQPLLANGGAE